MSDQNKLSGSEQLRQKIAVQIIEIMSDLGLTFEELTEKLKESGVDTSVDQVRDAVYNANITIGQLVTVVTAFGYDLKFGLVEKAKTIPTTNESEKDSSSL